MCQCKRASFDIAVIFPAVEEDTNIIAVKVSSCRYLDSRSHPHKFTVCYYFLVHSIVILVTLCFSSVAYVIFFVPRSATVCVENVAGA